MPVTQAFQEEYTVAVSASATPASVPLPAGASVAAPINLYAGDTVLVFNNSAATAHVSFNGVATAANLPIPAQGQRLLTIGPLAVTASVVLDAGTGTVYFSRGIGHTY